MRDNAFDEDFARQRKEFGGFSIMVFVCTWIYLHVSHQGFLAIFTFKGLAGLIAGIVGFPLTLGLFSYAVMRGLAKWAPSSTPTSFFSAIGVLLPIAVIWGGIELTRTMFQLVYGN